MKKESALIKGIDLYNKRKYMEAKNEFLIASEEGSDYEKVEANLYLGKIALRSDSELLFDAKNYIDYVLECGNDYQREQATFELATKYRILNYFDEAIKLYKKCLEIIPNDLYVLTDLVNLYLKLDEVNEAEKYCFYLLDGAKYSNSFRKKTISTNAAYLGLARVNFRKGDIKKLWEYLDKVEPLTKRDIEQKSDIEANLMFNQGKYDEATDKLQDSLHSNIAFIRELTKDKIAIMKSINGDVLASKITLNRNFPERPITKGGSVTLASIYENEKNYKGAYNLYFSLSFSNFEYLIDALKCAMHYDEALAVVTINRLLLTSVDKDKYLPYLIYLSKKYNIFFDGVNYNDMSLLAMEFLQHDEEKVKMFATYSGQLNYREGFTWDYVYDGIIKESLDNADSLENVSFVSDIIYDTYIIYVPYLAWEYKDYIVVKTYKGTKVPIEVTLQSKAYFDKQIPAYLLKQDNNVRKLFR